MEVFDKALIVARVQAVCGEDFTIQDISIGPGNAVSFSIDNGHALADASLERVELAMVQVTPLINDILVEYGLRSPEDPRDNPTIQIHEHGSQGTRSRILSNPKPDPSTEEAN